MTQFILPGVAMLLILATSSAAVMLIFIISGIIARVMTGLAKLIKAQKEE